MRNSGTLKAGLLHYFTGGCCLPGNNTIRMNFERRYLTFYASLFETLAEMLRLKGVFLSRSTSYPVTSSEFLLPELDSYFLILHAFR